MEEITNKNDDVDFAKILDNAKSSKSIELYLLQGANYHVDKYYSRLKIWRAASIISTAYFGYTGVVMACNGNFMKATIGGALCLASGYIAKELNHTINHVNNNRNMYIAKTMYNGFKVPYLARD